MKIAIIFGDFLVGHRPMDYNNLYSNPRGLSGADLGVSRVAQEFVKMGHDTSIFTVHTANKPEQWEGVKLYHMTDKQNIDDSYDVVISWCEPDQFRSIPSNIIRLCSQQLNGFTYCQPGFDDFVDIWASPSVSHMGVHAPQLPHPEKWVVVPDGCDPEVYSPNKVPGRVVYTSSPDRGLHWLLQEWQNIKARVPHASLRVFYHFSQGAVEHYEKTFQPITNLGYQVAPDILENGHFVRYIKNAIKKIAHLDVVHVGSVSRNQMIQELNQAEVFAYPASVTIPYVEGFSVSTMEACAAGCLPVISNINALESIYGGVAPMIKSPVQKHIKQFTDFVVKGMTDEVWKQENISKCKEIAYKNTWKLAAEEYIRVIKNSKKYKDKFQLLQ